jgi:hypothetical protein
MHKRISYGKLSISSRGRYLALSLLSSVLLILNSCITEFVPAVNEVQRLLVVEGLITDLRETDTVKLSWSSPIGKRSEFVPAAGAVVSISDDQGNLHTLTEITNGRYITDSSVFRGIVGRSYTLHVSLPVGTTVRNYESLPSEMLPVPPIDSVYFEKTVIQEKTENDPLINGCRIFLNTRDPENKCKFFRWDYSETWILRLLWPVDNMTCWITENSKTVNIKSTDALSMPVIEKQQVTYINNTTDRMSREYSILVNQYSLNPDEFVFWDKLQAITDQSGGLYDIIPSTIQSNIQCVTYPEIKVLGYFSVSAKKTKRIFIKDDFEGIINHYAKCVSDTAWTDDPSLIPFYGINVWPLYVQHPSFGVAAMTVLTEDKGCADCTVRGTKTKPSYWVDLK